MHGLDFLFSFLHRSCLFVFFIFLSYFSFLFIMNMKDMTGHEGKETFLSY